MDFHDVINVKTRKCVATLWTLDQAKKIRIFFGVCGLESQWNKTQERGVCSQKAKDGVCDIIVNVKKFNREIFNEMVKIIK